MLKLAYGNRELKKNSRVNTPGPQLKAREREGVAGEGRRPIGHDWHRAAKIVTFRRFLTHSSHVFNVTLSSQ